MKSLDPRIERLPEIGVAQPKKELDQFGTFEVFVQPREGKPFQHEGAVHAPNLEMAYVLAKEAFTRRFTCTAICVTDTRSVCVSPTTEDHQSAYELISPPTSGAKNKSFEIYHLNKRGKQHIHAGTVLADSGVAALQVAKEQFGHDHLVYNVWAIETSAIRATTPTEKDLWTTLPEKKFRDAADYKGGDKLKSFLEKQATSSK